MSRTNDQPGDLWLFGYGLIWKPPPHFDKRVVGYIEGYVRRFWQASQDHRGTPEAPGRVVTLITRRHWETLTDQHPSAPSRVWGAAYRIPASHVEEVRAYLDIREINGYSADMAAFHVPVHIPRHEAAADLTSGQRPETMSAPAPISCLVYIGTPENPQFVGPQDMDALAEHIAQSKGPSGRNAEYVYELAAALEQIRKDVGADIEVDEHAADLARRVRQMEKRTTGKTLQLGNEDRQVTMEETE